MLLIGGRAKNRKQAFASLVNSLFHFMRFLMQYNKKTLSTFFQMLITTLITIRDVEKENWI